MAEDIIFPYQLKFYYEIYDSSKEYKLKGDKVSDIVLKDGRLLSDLNPEEKQTCGVKRDSSRKVISQRFYDYTTTITIETIEALPVKIRWFEESSYSAPGFPSDGYCREYLTKVFVDGSGEVKVEKLDG